MRITCISDLHKHHNKVVIPECDMLIVAGDISNNGEISTLSGFSDWLAELPMAHKIVIAGNHDRSLEKGPQRELLIKKIQDAGAHYLENSEVVIEGLKIYGSPVTPFFHAWSWNVQRGPDIAKVWAQIPDDVDLVITHGPAFGILDEAPRGFGQYDNIGCQDLLARIQNLPKLKLAVCGHIHSAAGQKQVGNVMYVNASICNEAYQPLNPPIVVDI